MHVSDETLAGALRGDNAAFAAIVREHQAMVFGVAKHFLGDAAVAEEVSQDVFLELFRNLESIESPAHLTYWLRRVASNRCIDLSRRKRTRLERTVDEMPERAAWPAEADPMLARQLDTCVSTLAETPRMILVLRYQEDLDPTEIADALDMPVNTVKSHLRRSLALLRAKLTRCVGEVPV